MLVVVINTTLLAYLLVQNYEVEHPIFANNIMNLMCRIENADSTIKPEIC